MSRRRRADKREVLPDPKFGDVVLSKFMNSVMLDGKKSVAESIVYGALDTVEARGHVAADHRPEHVWRPRWLARSLNPFLLAQSPIRCGAARIKASNAGGSVRPLPAAKPSDEATVQHPAKVIRRRGAL